MKRILDNDLFNHYVIKHNIENIFDKDILKHAQLHFFMKGQDVFKAEFPLEYYYIIVDGKVKISYLLENGKSIVLKFYKSPYSLGDIELLNNLPIRCNVEAMDDTYLIGFPSDVLRKHIWIILNFYIT